MNSIAACNEGRVITESVSVRCSVVYEDSVDGWTCVAMLSGGGYMVRTASSVSGSHSNSTFADKSALATTGQMVLRSDRWTISVSAALHAEG